MDKLGIGGHDTSEANEFGAKDFYTRTTKRTKLRSAGARIGIEAGRLVQPSCEHLVCLAALVVCLSGARAP